MYPLFVLPEVPCPVCGATLVLPPGPRIAVDCACGLTVALDRATHNATWLVRTEADKRALVAGSSDWLRGLWATMGTGVEAPIGAPAPVRWTCARCGASTPLPEAAALVLCSGHCGLVAVHGVPDYHERRFWAVRDILRAPLHTAAGDGPGTGGAGAPSTAPPPTSEAEEALWRGWRR